MAGETTDNSLKFHTVEIISSLYKQAGELPDVVRAFCPDEFALDFGNEWNPAYGRGITGDVLGGLSKLLNKSGKTVTSPIMTALGWSGSSTPSIALTLSFNAETDPYTDVVIPIRNLLKMTVPKLRSSGFVADIPGPSSIQYMLQQLKQGINTMSGGSGAPSDEEENKIDNTISLRIGAVLTIPSVVVESLRLVGSTKVTREGLPISAQVNMLFKPFVAPFYDDIADMLYSGSLRQLGDWSL